MNNNIRKDFPLVNDWIYFDNACYSLKPIQVVEKVKQYYLEFPACAERSAHSLGNRASEEVEHARKSIAKLINADPEEIVFTKNTTEAINLIAASLNIKKEVITSDKEHNSNLLPWLKWNWKHKTVEHNNMDALSKQSFSLLSMPLVSNVDGSKINYKEVIEIAREKDALVLFDGAQGVPHMPIDVKKYDIDFLAFSGHKMLGPSGTGALYIKKDHFDKIDLFLVGGGMASDSTFNSYKPLPLPEGLEAGLQNYAGIIGFGEAARYLMKIGMENIEKHDNELIDFLLSEIEDRSLNIDILGAHTSIFSFNIEGFNYHELALMLDSKKIAIRSGMHCAYSWFHKYNKKGSARASLYLYNTKEEILAFVDALEEFISLI